MIAHNKHHNKKLSSGRGIVNSIIHKLPFELHLPGYQYCGTGTKLHKRPARSDSGINPLDVACKEHKIAYSNHKDIGKLHSADKILQEKAWMRLISNDEIEKCSISYK